MTSKLRYIWIDRNYLLHRKIEHMLISVVWKLPRKVVMWSAIRVIASATTGEYSNQVVSELTSMDALERWNNGG